MWQHEHLLIQIEKQTHLELLTNIMILHIHRFIAVVQTHSAQI